MGEEVKACAKAQKRGNLTVNIMQFPLLLQKILKIRAPKTTRIITRRRRTAIALPDPQLQNIWNVVQQNFFPSRTDLQEYVVMWSSRRQKRVLASVSLREKKVRVAKELNDPELAVFLEPLLYHEMCHAVLGENIGRYKGKRAWHGPQFKNLEQAHPQIPELEKWIKTGGWAKAVRVARGKESWQKRSK